MLPFLLRRDFIISPDFTPGFVSLGSVFLVSADLKLSRNILSGKGQMGRQGRDPGTTPPALCPWEIKCSTYLHSLRALGSEGARQWRTRGYLQLSLELQKPGPDEHFWRLGSRKFRFPCCRFTWWNLIPPPPLLWKWTQSSPWIWGPRAPETQNALLVHDTWSKCSQCTGMYHDMWSTCSKWGAFSLRLYFDSREMFFSGNFVVKRF